jgi:hypothetical protein
MVSKKAMNLVHKNINQPVEKTEENENESLLKTWLMSNSEPTIKKFLELQESDFKKPLNFSSKICRFLFKRSILKNMILNAPADIFSYRDSTFSSLY